MLDELLSTIGEGGVHSYRELEERLSVPQPLLEAMLEDLARLGYLRAIGGGCEGGCSGCPIGGCSVHGAEHVWVLTEKGSRAVVATGAIHRPGQAVEAPPSGPGSWA
jgi:hypothetical protein